MSDNELRPWPLAALARAAAHPVGCLVPDSDLDLAGEIQGNIADLIRRGWITQLEVSDPTLAWWFADDRPIGLVITDAGLVAAQDVAGEDEGVPAPTSKIGKVVALLGRADGASLREIGAMTGWQAQSVRAALTRLRKKGLNVVRIGEASETRYRVQESRP